MCGITGVLTFSRVNNISLFEIAHKMIDTLIHRGPDNRGVWIDEERGIALGHRRLSIVDPSPAGHQTMKSRRERYVIVFNGKVYNHESIRKELLEQDGTITFRGHS